MNSVIHNGNFTAVALKSILKYELYQSSFNKKKSMKCTNMTNICNV